MDGGMMNEKIMQKRIVVWIGAFVCCALWGSAFPCIKIGYSWMHIDKTASWTQVLYAGCRFTLAGIMVLIFGAFLQKNILVPKRKTIPKILKLCLFQTVLQYLFFYVGLANTDGTKASIIEAMNVFVAILIASLLYRQEKLTLQKIVGCIIGFIGVLFVNGTGNGVDYHITLFGEGFIFFSTVSYGFSSIYTQRYSKDENPVLLSGWQFILGGLIMILCGYGMGGHLESFSFRSIMILCYLAAVSAVAYTIWSLLLKYNSVSKVAVFGFMTPVFGFVLSAICLNEKDALGFSAVLALVLVCVGIYMVNTNRNIVKKKDL